MRRRRVVVIAGEFWLGASARGLADGFRALDCAVYEVDLSRHVGVFGRRFAGKAAGRLTAPLARDTFRAAAVDACESLRPDLFLTVKGTWLDTDTLARIRALGARTVMYYPDVDFRHAGVSADASLYDHYFTTKSFQLPHLAAQIPAERVTFLHHGYASGAHGPVYEGVEEADHTRDILHVGNHSDSKQAWLEAVPAAFPDRTFTVVGHRWSEIAAGSPLQSAVLGRALVGVAYSMAVQTARINLAIHHGKTASGWEDKVSTRTFELPAMRGFMLHVDNDEIRTLFEPGTEIDVFASPEEMTDKIRFYLDRPALRAQMVERAYRRCVPAYSYDSRARDMLDVLSR